MINRPQLQEHRSGRKEVNVSFRVDAARFAADLAQTQGYDNAIRITSNYGVELIGEGTTPNPNKAFYRNAYGYLKNRKSSDFASGRNKKRLAIK